MRSVLFTLAVFIASQAVAGTGGSAYTMFGIGDLRYYPNARSAGMGYTGIGLPSGSYVNSQVPASWSRINRVRIEANALYEGIQSQESNKSLYQGRGLFNGAMLAIPVSPANGIVFVGGFSPYSYIAYNNAFNNSQNGVDYSINEIGSGGLTKAQVGLSYAPIDDFSFGASLNYLFGKFTIERMFLPTTSGTAGATLFIDEENRGVNFTLSGMYTGFGNIGEGLRPLSLGVFVTTQSSLTFDLTNRLNFASESDTLNTVQRKLTVPVTIGVGAAYQIADRWLIAADYVSQAWGSAKYDGLPLLNIRNSNRFGIGAEKLPLKDASKWYDRLAYRLGFSYNSTYYKIYGEPINEWAVTGGFTMPVSGETRLHVGLEYAQRGAKTSALVNSNAVNLVKDNIVRVSFALSIAEPWFVRYEEE